MSTQEITTQRALSPTQINLADYVINPYRGCAFNCLYCYGRVNKSAQKTGFVPQVKINAPEILAKELRYLKPKRVLMGSTTECFQPLELKYRITRKILTILNENKIPYTILTKSALIQQDLDLIAANPANKVFFTFNTPNDRIIKLLETGSPELGPRLETLRQIIHHDIGLRVHIGPFIPYLCRVDEILEILPAGVKEIDVEFYHHKMGNFAQIIKAVSSGFNPDTAAKLTTLYSNGQNYYAFTEELKHQLILAKGHYPFKMFFVAPEYEQFYNPGLDYQQAL